VDAVTRFEQKTFDYVEIRKWAEHFSEERFKREILEFVLSNYAI
jgi:hypothetical protein